jgi:hypothetical protein
MSNKRNIVFADFENKEYEALDEEIKKSILAEALHFDEELTLDDGVTTVRCRFDDKILNVIKEWLGRLRRQRGIKDANQVGRGDKTVQQITRAIIKERKDDGLTGASLAVDVYEEAEIISNVVSQHEAEGRKALVDIVTWAMLRDDIFMTDKGRVGWRDDINVPSIPKEYWDAVEKGRIYTLEKEEEDKNELDLILEKAYQQEKFIPRYKRAGIETFIAVTTLLLAQNPQFRQTVDEYLGYVVLYVGIDNTEVMNDAGFLKNRLDAALARIRKGSSERTAPAGTEPASSE